MDVSNKKVGIVQRSLQSIGTYLSPSQKRGALFLFMLSLVASLLDVFGLASLVPIVLITAEPGGVFKNKWTNYLYNHLPFDSEKTFLVALIFGFLIFFLLKTIFTTWVNYRQAKFTGDVGYDLITKQVSKYLRLPYWQFSDLGSAKLMNTALDIPIIYMQNILRPAVSLLSEGLIALVIVIAILVYKPVLILVLVLVLGPMCILTYRAIRVRAQHLGKRLNELRAVSLALVGDLFNGFIELRLAGRQEKFADYLFVRQRESQDLDARAYLYLQLPAKVIELAAIMGVLVLFLYVILAGPSSTNLVTLIGLFAAAAYRLMPSLNRIMSSVVQFRNYQFVIDELESNQHLTALSLPNPNDTPLRFRHNLALQELSFQFPGADKPALDHISLTISKGEKIGFIGTSGSGKTTLMNVLLRFYIEQKGHILVDDVLLSEKELGAWHRLIGYVKQDTFLMQASIRDNITLGEEQPDEIRLAKAIEQASLKQFVDSLPAGDATHIGERGSKLSGGQRQRIGIARALYKQAEVLILDEATSALDNETEREVSEAINRLSQTDMTILIVAHRLTTLRECNRIYELSEGQLIAVHQYDDLITRIA
jgi:ABC-type multidrug transport system fused ATPase/permease subunit